MSRPASVKRKNNCLDATPERLSIARGIGLDTPVLISIDEGVKRRQINHIFDSEFRRDTLSEPLYRAGMQYREMMARAQTNSKFDVDEDRGKAFRAASSAIRDNLRREFNGWLERAEYLDMGLSDLGRQFAGRGTPEEIGRQVINLALKDLAKHFHIRVQ